MIEQAPTPGRIEARGFHFHRGVEKWIVKGVTYGPFRPRRDGSQFPERERIQSDLDMMVLAGVNTIRLYTNPGNDLADLAAARDIHLLVDVPWPKHIDVYNSRDLEEMCLSMVGEGARTASQWPNVLGMMVGNEVPPDLARWATPRKVEAFLRRLYGHAKSINPEILVGFANFPSTEFLQLHFFDFLGFNVYLEDEEELRGYLHRLRHLYPETPLILSETGLDSLRNGEEAQAQVIDFSLKAAFSTGMAGALIFSWTDEWHTGGYDIEEWRFGLLSRERAPKPALGVVRNLFQNAPQVGLLQEKTRVSIVVATYNGGATLAECLDSLGRLNYPNYEVVVIDDGSTDDTAEILARYPNVRVHRQENKGLSEARNMGIRLATGEIVAFTDSDCVADPDWAYFLVQTMQSQPCAGVGGPNLTPWEERPLHRTVACAPGHATHVLLDSFEAEHVPGCNMAFWKSDLLAVGCFDPLFRKAGDDVDIIWRLQDHGERILFAPAAFVWHHRRATIGAYLKQQQGYGEAEALLARKHPHRFNDRGQSLWRGVIYSGPELLPVLKPHDIHFGVFGSAGFQCLYERRSGLLSHLLTSFEWWLLCALLLGAGLYSRAALLAGLAAVAATLIINGVRAHRTFVKTGGVERRYFPVVWLLWVLQPVVRGYRRSLGLFSQTRAPRLFREELARERSAASLPRRFSMVREYWSENGAGRLDLIRGFIRAMDGRGWLHMPNSGWESWDFSVILSQFFRSKVVTAEEDHGEGRRMFRVRYSISPTSLLWFLVGAGIIVCLLVAFQDTVIARILAILLLVTGWLMYSRALRAQGMVSRAFEEMLLEYDYQPVLREKRPRPASPPVLDDSTHHAS